MWGGPSRMGREKKENHGGGVVTLGLFPEAMVGNVVNFKGNSGSHMGAQLQS